jgi:hypothetical protein
MGDLISANADHPKPTEEGPMTSKIAVVARGSIHASQFAPEREPHCQRKFVPRPAVVSQRKEGREKGKVVA